MKISVMIDFIEMQKSFELPKRDRLNVYVYPLNHIHKFIDRVCKKYKLNIVQKHFLMVYAGKSFGRNIKIPNYYASSTLIDSKKDKQFCRNSSRLINQLWIKGIEELPLRTIISPEFGALCYIKTMEKM